MTGGGELQLFNSRRPSKTGWQVPNELVETGQQHTAVSARDANLFTLRSRIGGEPYSVNHSVYDYHNRFGDKHPEWFVGNSPGQNVQLKFGHPEVIKQIAEDAKQFFSHPFSFRRFGTKETQAGTVSAGDFFAVGPKDNRDYGDDTRPPLQPERQGPNFGNGVASNYIWNAVNEVAKITGKDYPDYYITSFAYAAMFEPPDFPLKRNVAVTVCMADGWVGYGMEVLREWRKRVSRLFTWEYYIDHLERFPRIRPRAIARYIRELQDMGLDGMFIEMPSLPGLQNRNPGLYHINYYVTFRFLREREVDIEAVLKEYYRLFYGPAAKPMEVFWETLEEAYEESLTEEYIGAKGSRQVKEWTLLATPERMKLLRGALERAERLVCEEPYISRVKLVRNSALGRIETNLKRHREIYGSEPPSINAPRIKESIVLDGSLEESFWEKAAVTSSFVNLYGKPLDTVTSAYVSYDERNLYIGFRCSEPFIDKQRLDQRVSTAGICTDDSVEVVIDVNRRLSDYFHVMMNADGLIWYRWPGRYRTPESFDFNPEIKGKAYRGKDAWTAEFVIPLSSLTDVPPRKGDEWGINFYRNRVPTMKWADPRMWSAWSPTFSATYHVVDRFGILKFSD